MHVQVAANVHPTTCLHAHASYTHYMCTCPCIVRYPPNNSAFLSLECNFAHDILPQVYRSQMVLIREARGWSDHSQGRMPCTSTSARVDSHLYPLPSSASSISSSLWATETALWRCARSLAHGVAVSSSESQCKGTSR